MVQHEGAEIYLCCNLAAVSTCRWAGVLVQVGSKFELRMVPRFKEHNGCSPLKEQRAGFETHAQRHEASKLLRLSLSTTPDVVLRTMRLDDAMRSECLKLQQIEEERGLGWRSRQ